MSAPITTATNVTINVTMVTATAATFTKRREEKGRIYSSRRRGDLSGRVVLDAARAGRTGLLALRLGMERLMERCP